MIVFGMMWLVEINYARISVYQNVYLLIQLILIIVMWLDHHVMELNNALKFLMLQIALFIQ